MSYIGNSPGVSSQRVVTEEVISGSAKSAFYPVGGYALGYVDVLINGLEVDSADFTAADGVVVTLATAAQIGDTVKIKAYIPRGLSDGYLKSEADAKFVENSELSVASANELLRVTSVNASAPTDSVVVTAAGGLQLSGDVGLGAAPITGGATGRWMTFSNVGGAGNYSGGPIYAVSGSTKGYQYYQSDYIVHQATSGIGHKFLMNNGDKEISFSSGGNIVMPSGGGIDFSASSNSSGATAEILNDYEEGAWTPTMLATGGSTYATFTTATSRYVKVGSLVTLFLYVYSLNFAAITNGTYVVIGGLPFSRRLGTYSVALFGYNNTNISDGYVETGEQIYLCNAAGAEFVQSNNDISGGRFMMTVTYHSA